MCAEGTYQFGWSVVAYPPTAVKLDGGTATFNGTIASLEWRGAENYHNQLGYDAVTLQFEYDSDGTWSASASGFSVILDQVSCGTIPKASYGQWQSLSCQWPGVADLAFAINMTP
jgi:hypothetical protein